MDSAFVTDFSMKYSESKRNENVTEKGNKTVTSKVNKITCLQIFCYKIGYKKNYKILLLLDQTAYIAFRQCFINGLPF